MFNFIDTGLDAAIVKSIGKVEKEVLVHGEYKDFYRKQLVNAGEVESVSGKVFKTDEEAEDFFEFTDPKTGEYSRKDSRAGIFRRQLSEDEKDAIYAYTDYQDKEINTPLRNGEKLSEKVQKLVNNLDSAISKFDLDTDIKVYRVLKPPSPKDFPSMLERFKPGTVITEKGFCSTTVSAAVSLNAFKDSPRIRLIIDIPKGKGRGAYINQLTNNRGEFEFLLHRDSKIKILRAEKGEGGIDYDLYCSYIPNPN